MLVKVIDALCGQGKTKKMMKDMAEMPEENKIIYITPLLSETHRIAGTSYDNGDEKKKPIKNEQGRYQYDMSHPLVNRRFRHPQSQQGDGKRGGLLYLVQNNENIVATHALFLMLTPEIVREITERNYHLVMDEVLDVWNVWQPEDTQLKPKEVPTLLKNNTLGLLDDGMTLCFNHEQFGQAVDTSYEELAAICDLQQLLYVNNTAIWQMPFSALKAFKSVTVGTYLYEGSLLSAYLNHFEAKVEVIYFGKSPAQIKHLVTIIEDKKLNAVGEKRNALSYNRLTSSGNTALLAQLKNNLSTLYKGRSSKRPANKQADRLWTTAKNAKDKIKGKEFGASWLAATTKATNDYSDRWYLAYLLEKNMKPPISVLLGKMEVAIDEDKYAIGEMVQWIWRSRIRKEQEIWLYMPSKRMRDLFKEWLNMHHGANVNVTKDFVPRTNPFKPNGMMSKEWYEAAVSAGVSDKESWDEFRRLILDSVDSSRLLPISDEMEVVAIPW